MAADLIAIMMAVGVAFGALTPALIVVSVVLARADAPAWATYVTGAVFTLLIVLRVMVPGFSLPAPEAWHRTPPDPRSGGRG